MRGNVLKCVFINIAAAASFSAVAQAANSPEGIWIDHTGRGGVEIKTCDNGQLCGHVVWLKDQTDAKGCGLQILGDVKSIGGGQWDNGWIYSPEKKQKFSVELTPLDGNRLRVKGYKGIKLFSKTMVWHKASSSLQRCDAATTAKAKPSVETATVEQPAIVTETQPEAPAKTARVEQSEPTIINPNASGNSAQDRVEARTDQAQSEPAPRTANGRGPDRDDHNDGSIYAEPNAQDRDRDDENYAEDRGDDRDEDRGIDGFASLIEKFTGDDGVEVGDGYGMKVEKGPDGEKNCHLNVPFVSVKFPCKDR